MADHAAPVPAVHEVGTEATKATSAEAVKVAGEAALNTTQSHDAIPHATQQGTAADTTVPPIETVSKEAVEPLTVVPAVEKADTTTAASSEPAGNATEVPAAAEAAIDPLPVVPQPKVASEATNPPAPTAVEAAPDPDEDDLDDLDELLDEFSATNISAPQQPVAAAAAASGPGRPATSDPSDPLAATHVPTDSAAATAAATSTASKAAGPNPNYPAFPFDPLAPLPANDDEFARQLQAGMADLLSEMDSSPEMQKQFEDMMRELAQSAADGSAPGSAATPAAAGATGTTAREAEASTNPLPQPGQPPLSFQDSIKATMDRIQNSDTSSTSAAAASASSSQEADFMAALLKEMESGAGGDEDFSKMLLGMMEQLTNKDILYEPMKELNQKFPGWLESHKDQVSTEDLNRYKEQQSLVGQIVAKFEEAGYKDDDAKAREFVVDKMQKMQSLGSPPADLVGDMDAAQDALGGLDEGCPTQ